MHKRQMSKTVKWRSTPYVFFIAHLSVFPLHQPQGDQHRHQHDHEHHDGHGGGIKEYFAIS